VPKNGVEASPPTIFHLVKKRRKTMVDLSFANHGSLIGITPNTDAGRKWIEDFVQDEPWQWLGPSLNVEPRYAWTICQGAIADGLECA
jgi:hypothetical protein